MCAMWIERQSRCSKASGIFNDLINAEWYPQCGLISGTFHDLINAHWYPQYGLISGIFHQLRMMMMIPPNFCTRKGGRKTLFYTESYPQFWTKWNSILLKIERTITTIIFHSVWKENLFFVSICAYSLQAPKNGSYL